MYRLNTKERRIGGLLLEALVLIFVFSGAWSQPESDAAHSGDLVVKTSPVEQIAFRDSDTYVKSLLDFVTKVQAVASDFSESNIDVAELLVRNTTCLCVGHSLYNCFYTHLTAKAP
jgi:hypothetical protein